MSTPPIHTGKVSYDLPILPNQPYRTERTARTWIRWPASMKHGRARRLRLRPPLPLSFAESSPAVNVRRSTTLSSSAPVAASPHLPTHPPRASSASPDLRRRLLGGGGSEALADTSGRWNERMRGGERDADMRSPRVRFAKSDSACESCWKSLQSPFLPQTAYAHPHARAAADGLIGLEFNGSSISIFSSSSSETNGQKIVSQTERSL